MTIITISRGSNSRGKEIAEKVAAELGYDCVAREALLEASKEFDIPEAKLVRAVHDAPSIFDRLAHGKEKYIAYIQDALVHRVQQGNVVYHGLAGHFLLRGISHVLKVRITADIEDRIAVVMERDKVDRKAAMQILKHDDEQRRNRFFHEEKHLCHLPGGKGYVEVPPSQEDGPFSYAQRRQPAGFHRGGLPDLPGPPKA